MFLGHLLTFEERQKLLKLSGWNLIETAPKYMEVSKSVCSLRYVNTKFGNSSVVNHFMFPRIRAKVVMRLYRNFRRGQRGILLEQLSILFLLGLGVPKHKQIAEYITRIDEVDDQPQAIKYIGKLIKHYIAQYKLSMGDHEYMYCAQYTEQLLLMKKFISKAKPENAKSMAVPKGIPTVLVYSLTDYHGAKFGLVDGYSFSKTGFPVPISASVLRKEFTAAPRQFNSYSLKTHGQYMLVFGIMYWHENSEENFQHMQALDTDEYEVLIDQFDKYNSDEMIEARKFRMIDKDIHEQHRQALEVLAVKDEPSKKERRLVREAETYFKEREDGLKTLTRLERRAASALEKDGPVSSAKFFALDLGAIGASRKLRSMVNAKPDTLAKSFNAWGFTTALANVECPMTRIYYGVKSNRRSWQIETEKH